MLKPIHRYAIYIIVICLFENHIIDIQPELTNLRDHFEIIVDVNAHGKTG